MFYLKTEYQEKNMNTTCNYFSIILLLQTNFSICGYIVLYKNKHIIVNLTEVLVLYISKFNVLHTALLFTTGIVAEIILTSASSRDWSKKRHRHVFWYLAPMNTCQWLVSLKGVSINLMCLTWPLETKRDNPLTLGIYIFLYSPNKRKNMQ